MLGPMPGMFGLAEKMLIVNVEQAKLGIIFLLLIMY